MDTKSIILNRNLDERSIANQLAAEISRQIRSGALLPGERLPAERELVDILGISRGTVKRAYLKLMNSSAIEIRHGSGSYVLANGQIFEDNQKKEAAEIIANMFSHLTSMGMSESEILSLINLHIATKNCMKRISIMVVSNNHDILSQLEEQFSYLSSDSLFSFSISFFTLSNVETSIKSTSTTPYTPQKYDLIISSIIDYDRICELLPDCKAKIICAHISPRTRTLKALSTLPRESRITLVYQTQVFLNQMVNTLLSMNFPEDNLFPVHELAYNPTHLSDGNIDVILNFNESPIYINPAFDERVREFTSAGGRIIQFEYRLSRESLSCIESRIQAILMTRGQLGVENFV